MKRAPSSIELQAMCRSAYWYGEHTGDYDMNRATEEDWFKKNTRPPLPAGWIPCAGRMPDPNFDVLAWMDGMVVRCWFNDDTNSWQDAEGVFVEEPTHWMPLPEGPK